MTIDGGAVPSLNAVAEAAGVSKGGLTHHFPTRDALVVGLAREALAEVDRAMSLAATEGRAAKTWLHLSVPNASERDLFRALVAAHYALDGRLAELVQESNAATARWEAMIATELGDPIRAKVLRLVGDGLAANAMIAPEFAPTDQEIDELFVSIVDPPGRAR